MGGVQIAEQSGLIAWVGQYGNVVFFFAQLTYWLLIAAAAIYAVYQLKRFVDFKMGVVGGATSDGAEAASGDDASKETIKIEEFVE